MGTTFGRFGDELGGCLQNIRVSIGGTFSVVQTTRFVEPKATGGPNA